MNVFLRNYPEYLMEAAGLGILMISASLATTVLEHPASAIHQAITDPALRRFIIGLIVGLTIIALIYSPGGQQSGAHFNPVVTLTFLRLGKIKPHDAFFYIVAHFLGGCLGILIAAGILGHMIADPSIQYIVTVPGSSGPMAAFYAEFAISFGLMMILLIVSNTLKWARFTGLLAGMLITVYITIEAPLSGMSMNPARTLSSALLAQTWTEIWIYFTAPLLGMFLAAEIYLRFKGRRAVACAKLHHHNHKRCIFNCGYQESGVLFNHGSRLK